MPPRPAAVWSRRRFALAAAWALFGAAAPAVAVGAREQVLYRFGGVPDANAPYSPLVVGRAGVLYGTTGTGGLTTVNNGFGFGAVFQLAPPATPGGAWRETVPYRFTGGGDGAYPAGLTPGAAGSLFGLTSFGGANGAGTAFRLLPGASGGTWTRSPVHVFGQPGDGRVPTGSLLAGSGGALYGTTVAGGAAGLGTVYMIAPPSGGGWSESVLYGFSGGDGASPQASLLADASGALYGTTASGGAGPCFGGCGTVFKLTPPVAAGAPWTESVLYGFSGGGDGRAPFAPLVADANGALYGTTVQGGVTAGGGAGFGTVFRLAPPAIAGGAWTLSTLYTFTGGNDAGAPFGGVVLTHGGGLLGTAYNSSLFGGGNRFGVVYRLTPPAVPGGAWTAALVYGFRGAAGSDGAGPYAGLTAATAAGTYYGTTQSGGVNGWGTVFQITP